MSSNPQHSMPDDPQPDESRTYRLFAWLQDHLTAMVAALVLAAVVLPPIVGHEIPRNVRIIGVVSGVVMLLVGRPTARRVKALLYDPNDIWVVDLDAAERDGALYCVPASTFGREWEVREDDLLWLTPELVTGKNVDLDAQEITGTWAGTKTDWELLESLQTVREVQGELEKRARKGFELDAQGFVLIRRATQTAVKHLVDTFEKGTLPDEGEGLSQEIDKALEAHGLDRNLTELDVQDSPLASDLERSRGTLDGDGDDQEPTDADGEPEPAQELAADLMGDD